MQVEISDIGGHWFSASGDIRHLICHVISQSHVIEGSCNLKSGRSSLHVTTMPGSLAIGIVVVEMFLVFPVRPRDQRVMQLHGQESLNVSHHPPMFCGHRQCDSGDIIILDCHVIWHDHMI